MMLFLAVFFKLLMSCLVTSNTPENYSIVAKNETLFVQRGQNAVLNWVMVNYPNTNKTVKCTAKNKNIVFAVGAYSVMNRRITFRIPQNSQSQFDFRLHGVVYVQPQNSNMLTLTIEKSKSTDSDKYICTYGEKSSEIKLQVFSDLIEMGKLVPSIILVPNKKKTVSVELCATPEPQVTMELLGVVTKVKGNQKPNSNCYEFIFQNLTLTQQKHCGEELKLTYKGVKKTIRRSVKLIIPLTARAPQNVRIRVRDSEECSMIRWDGPNIGSCIADSLWYDIAIYEHNHILRRMRTSSNVIEACGINFLRKEITVKVLNILGNTNSTWTEGSLVLDEKPYDGMQTAIIACAALVGFLLMLLLAYCCYRHKYSPTKHCCTHEKNLLVKTASEEEDDEITPLNTTLSSMISPQKQQSQPIESQKNETKRKTSRKISLDTFLGENHILRKNSSGAAEQNKVHPPKVNHNTRFYSLQRNIERERKKLEEQELEQQLDDMYSKRRNTDSKVFQDFKNHLNQHHFGPRSSGEAEITEPLPPGSPLYDVLPSTRSSTSNTRSSASTNSTGPSYHEDDERPPPIGRRRNTIEHNLPEINNSMPLYDVLPRTNTNIAQQPYTAQKENQVYDYIPTVRTLERNGHAPGKNTIYDVPVKPPVQPTVNGNDTATATATDAKFEPFSSHRKQRRNNEEEVYENR